jgi:transposase
METLFVGIDVAKDALDVAVRPTDQSWRVANTAEGIAELVTTLAARAPAGIVLEPSGGYEHDVAAALGIAGLPVAVVNARQVRDFAKATGQLAKTDRLDARILARFAEAVRPEPRPLPDAAAEELRSLLVRYQQVVSMTTAEKNRLKTANRAVRSHIKAHIAWLESQRDELDAELRTRLKASPIWREKEDLLRSIKGIGPIASFTLLAALPELGRLTHKEIAALAGLAPLARDSGTLRGKRTIWGGRAKVRRGLYMAAVAAARYNPVIRAFYQRLLARGKAKKLALTACMHKLLIICNAVLRTRTPWDPARAGAHTS